MLMLNKKALFQVDSAISVSLFLLYVVWLLLFVKNYNMSSPSSVSVFPDLSSLKWSVNKLSFFIDSNQVFPVVVELPEERNISQSHSAVFSYSNSNIPFVLHDHSLIFLNNDSSGAYYLINSKSGYSSRVFKQVIGNIFYLSTQSIRCEFNNSLPSNLISTKGTLVKNASFYADGASLTFANSSLFRGSSISYIVGSSPSVNSSCFVFGGFNNIFCMLDYAYPLSTQVDFKMSNFSYFYADNNNFGYLNSSISKCYNFSSSHILLSHKGLGSSSLALVFSPSNVSLCTDSQGVSLTLKSGYNRRFVYSFYIPDDYNSQNVTFPEQKIRFGSLEELEGLSPNLLMNASFLSSWFEDRFPNNFGLTVYFNNSQVSINPSPNGVDVYSSTKIFPVLLANGSFSHALITIRSWSSNE